MFVGRREGAGKDAGGEGGGGEAKLEIPMMKKNIAEFELTLLHLHRNVEVPETKLIVHHVIQWAVELVCTLFL